MATSPQSLTEKEIIIYVTGFGLFDGLEKNASWEAVRLLPSNHHFKNNIRCIIKRLQVPVEYAAVDRAIDKIWTENPDVIYNFNF